MDKKLRSKLLPFILTFVVIVLDQITKMLVVANIPPNRIGFQCLGDFFRIVHLSNTGVAFSMGATWSDSVRRILFAFLPVIVIAVVIIVYFKNKDFTSIQRWAICGIIGGGIGNLIDRFFRAEGVVDFIDVKFYGLFGLERWPTFNIADSAVVVCGIMLLISFLVIISRETKSEKKN